MNEMHKAAPKTLILARRTEVQHQDELRPLARSSHDSLRLATESANLTSLMKQVAASVNDTATSPQTR